MKNYLNIFGLIIISAFISCNKFLDVKPEDKFLSNQIFSDESAINSAWNGVYLNIAKPALYGGRMSMSNVDIMAQYYNIPQTNSWTQNASYNYANLPLQGQFEGIWNSFYVAILNTNSFIQQLNATKSTVIADQHKQILLGEAYAMRAYLHFDVLRLFGPVYSKDSVKIAIPYFKIPTSQTQPLLPAKAVMDSVMSDLDAAELMLKDDPIQTQGVVKITDNTDVKESFYKLRNRRLNYYAVKAIKARVLLYRGDKADALKIVKSVINDASKWFPWSPDLASLPGSSLGPDRVFSSEVIMGIQNYDMYSQQTNFFNSALTDEVILAPSTVRLSEIFENNENDYRYRVNFGSGAGNNKTYKVFTKYADVSNKTLLLRNFQPLIRMSEMYYIAAECEPAQGQALGYLNLVRQHRGLIALTADANLAAELYKEYRKEFWGEGQTFFYFKRTGRAILTNGSSTSAIAMSPTKYVVPIPSSETINR